MTSIRSTAPFGRIFPKSARSSTIGEQGTILGCELTVLAAASEREDLIQVERAKGGGCGNSSTSPKTGRHMKDRIQLLFALAAHGGRTDTVLRWETR
jgi:hypothetical protein